MAITSAPAPAKVNLALHVGAVRPDRYHPVDTVCAFVDIGERVSITSSALEFQLTVRGDEFTGPIPDANDNLILRGARALAEKTKVPRVAFDLAKAAPVASGIGAGTSDGAAAMALLNQHADRPLSSAEMISLSRVLGADGPVCMARQLRPGLLFRAQGVGHNISVEFNSSPFWLCLANPRRACSTADVFRAFDRHTAPRPFDLPRLPRGAGLEQIGSWMTRTRNDLAGAATAMLPAIESLRTAMAARPGCLASRMSGSGATVFGVFADEQSASRAARSFQSRRQWAVAGAVMSEAVVG